jgi:hypothetical protein
MGGKEIPDGRKRTLGVVEKRLDRHRLLRLDRGRRQQQNAEENCRGFHNRNRSTG